MVSEPNYKKLFMIALSDLSYAQGIIEGLGHKNTYITEQVGSMLEVLEDQEKDMSGTSMSLPKPNATRTIKKGL